MTTSPPRPRGGGTRLPSVATRGRLASDPDVAYAFTGRADGTMSDRVGDGDHRRARAQVAAALGVGQVAWMDQVHGGDVAVATQPPGPPPACDGIVGLGSAAVGVLVADCVPVLLAGPDGVAAAHAGRPGVLADVTGATVHELCDRTGSAADQLAAIIGPAVGACCYEVPAEMADAAERAVPGTRATTTWGTPSIDLVAGVVSQLTARGVRDVARAGTCTRCDDRWFSHRATTGPEGRPAGRQAGVIARRPGSGGMS